MSYDTLVKALREVVKKELEISLDVGNVSSATSTTLVDSSKNWATNQWANCFVEITDGTGEGQIRKIISNTATTLTIETSWSTNPDNTSKYRIFGSPSYTEEYYVVRDKVVQANEKLYIASGQEVTFNNLTIESQGYVGIAGILRVLGSLKVKEGGKMVFENEGILKRKV